MLGDAPADCIVNPRPGVGGRNPIHPARTPAGLLAPLRLANGMERSHAGPASAAVAPGIGEAGQDVVAEAVERDLYAAASFQHIAGVLALAIGGADVIKDIRADGRSRQAMKSSPLAIGQ